MNIPTRRPLGEFAAMIAATDEHGPYHLRLLDEAARALAGLTEIAIPRRLELADKLERWRYQLLGHRPAARGTANRALAESLDLAANELARRPARAPRAVRKALDPTAGPSMWHRQPGGLDLAEVEASLRRDAGLDELVRRAAACTVGQFRGPIAPESASASPVHSGLIPGQPSASPARKMLLYAPLYASNFCINHCLYCAFRYPQRLQRQHLDRSAVLRQAQILWRRGLRHLLLVAGDFPKLTSTDYFAEIVADLRDQGFSIAVEIAAQSTASYARLVEAGACGVTLYQETYDEQLYARYHPRGTKAPFDWRLEALERAAEAGMPRLGLGVLLGLGEPVYDVLTMIRHGQYLRTRFPEVSLAFSLPRIHEAPGGFRPPYAVDDDVFVRFYCVLRLAFPRAHLVLSTRERTELRNRLAKICITQMSAGSCTAPGGYTADVANQRGGQQFPVADHRAPEEVAQWLRAAGLEVSWKIESEPQP